MESEKKSEIYMSLIIKRKLIKGPSLVKVRYSVRTKP